MHIGLIGGNGVAATVVCHQRLTAAMAARRARLELATARASIGQAEIYIRLIDRSRGAGDQCAATPGLAEAA